MSVKKNFIPFWEKPEKIKDDRPVLRLPLPSIQYIKEKEREENEKKEDTPSVIIIEM